MEQSALAARILTEEIPLILRNRDPLVLNKEFWDAHKTSLPHVLAAVDMSLQLERSSKTSALEQLTRLDFPNLKLQVR